MSRQTNRLAGETSPYLLQHQENPVDWYPWGNEAFREARDQDIPILLSVGYSSCHWCHVMAHESFEDEAIARVMNRHFISVKVDREERPDIDAIYMSAVQAMTGKGGWPMTVVLTPNGEPFFAGTYFPVEDRYGQPAFGRVLRALIDLWEGRREEVENSASNITKHLQRAFELPAGEGEAELVELCSVVESLQGQFDSKHGGFGGAPKFPPHALLRFLLTQENPKAREMAYFTLTKMARGGIFDQLGGGFSRYSVDERWLVPHFEKMLYDNAQLVSSFAQAYRQTGDALYLGTVEKTLAWVSREMTSAEGGFYSALDADSEGEEGKFYVWDFTELEKVLGDDTELVASYFGATESGNFEGRNVLEIPSEDNVFAERFGVTIEEIVVRIGQARSALFETRETRIRPGLDDKILTSWNGLMLGAYADAGRLLGREDYIYAAQRNAWFVKDKLYSQGRLLHSYKDGEAKIEGLLEDYAFFGLGLLSLYRATFEATWLELAVDLAKSVAEHFRDPRGGFFNTPDDGEALIVRPKGIFDSATPAEGFAAAELLFRVGRFVGNHSYEEVAAESVRSVRNVMASQPRGFGTALLVTEALLSPPREVVIVGNPGADDTRALVQVLNDRDLSQVVEVLSAGSCDPLLQILPLLVERCAVGGRATAYVCEGGVCRLPVTSPDDFAEQLDTGFGP
jgi:uncharacterized protein YyaL (SSP411 family)